MGCLCILFNSPAACIQKLSFLYLIHSGMQLLSGMASLLCLQI